MLLSLSGSTICREWTFFGRDIRTGTPYSCLMYECGVANQEMILRGRLNVSSDASC